MSQPESSHAWSPSHYTAAETAVFLLDFHKGFVARSSEAEEAVRVAADVQRWAQALGIPVVHGLIDVDQEPVAVSKYAPVFGGLASAMKLDGGHKELAVVLDSAENDVFFKRQPGLLSALTPPDLQEYLAKRGTRSLILTGLSSSNCVMKTAICGVENGFVVTVVSDACADTDPETHATVMTKILPSTVHVVSAQELKNSRRSRGD